LQLRNKSSFAEKTPEKGGTKERWGQSIRKCQSKKTTIQLIAASEQEEHKIRAEHWKENKKRWNMGEGTERRGQKQKERDREKARKKGYGKTLTGARRGKLTKKKKKGGKRKGKCMRKKRGKGSVQGTEGAGDRAGL